MAVKLREAEALSKKLRKLTGTQKKLLSRMLELNVTVINRASVNVASSQALYDKLYLLMNVNVFTKPENADDLEKYLRNIEYSANLGLKFGKKSIIDKQAQKQLVSVIKENGMKYVTNLGDELKTGLVDVLSSGLTSGTAHPEIANQMKELIGSNISRAETIARTETMRANVATLYADAKSIGATHFVVDNRAEACESCQEEYEDQVFTIDQTDMLPPLHPNCACVAVFFDNEEEANQWGMDLANEKQGIRDDLVKDGFTIKPDGTSQNTNN